MKKIYVTLLVSCATLFFQGCATIVVGSSKAINIATSDSSRVQAEVKTATGTQSVMLPTTVNVKTGKGKVEVIIKEKGYQETTFAKESKMTPWFWGNIIFGGVFGSSTDSVTGSMWTYDDSIIVPVVKE